MKSEPDHAALAASRQVGVAGAETLPPFQARMARDLAGQKVFQQSNYLPSHPKVPAKQPDLKPGGGRFKQAYYINPDVQYDKGNEWVEYFNNVFMK